MELNDFMETSFPGLSLRPPLFYDWPIGIRFELGDPQLPFAEKRLYVRQAADRAIALYEHLHAGDDELLIVTNVNVPPPPSNRPWRRLNVYRDRIRSRQAIRNLRHYTLPNVFGEEGQTHRFVLECRSRDFRHAGLIRAICNQEMGFKPATFHDVFWINTTRQTIFHVYDDRGCDVIAASRDVLRPVYRACGDWILAYDRERIDSVFAE